VIDEKALKASAQSWVGTPFAPNGNTKGMGVSCQRLVVEIYREAGLGKFSVPDVSMSHAKFAKTSIIEEWFAGNNSFERVTDLQVGDILGFRINKVIHHIGIFLGDGQFIHALFQVGAVVSNLSDPTWGSRHKATWRLK